MSPAAAAIGPSFSGSSRSSRSSRIMYSRATRYELESTFTSRSRTRPVPGSLNDPNASGTMCPSWIVIMPPGSPLASTRFR